MSVERKPFVCPDCGGTDFKANYYEAVWQSIAVDDVNGQPEFVDYTGSSGTYDDGSTVDEAIACCSCDWTSYLGTFELLYEDEYTVLHAARAAKLELGKIAELCSLIRTALTDQDAISDEEYAVAVAATEGSWSAGDAVPLIYAVHQLDTIINALTPAEPGEAENAAGDAS